ncbi:nicotinamide riboside kinase 1 [Plakobranchus ocellatus]|uniref:Nicotinamide riboside kinase 1 n=1 Tax=Plakobranchus ocellatus TaxID=259542 RepID=A0AAV4BZX3_9GAST|nr:nicotinamide riboside kinase 1 [Plakobranchus ocellatus]
MAFRNYVIVGLSGTTNSGKSTLASMLCKSLPRASSICQDHYFYEPDDPRVRIDEDGKQNWEELQAMDMDQMMKDVNSWVQKNQTNKERTYLIIEGFLIFNHRPLTSFFDKKFFIKIDRDTCAERRSKRIYNPPDYPGYFESKVWPMYLKNLDDIQDQTDIEFLQESNDLDTMHEFLKKTILEL